MPPAGEFRVKLSSGHTQEFRMGLRDKIIDFNRPNLFERLETYLTVASESLEQEKNVEKDAPECLHEARPPVYLAELRWMVAQRSQSLVEESQ